MSRDWESARARSRYSKRERERARARRSSLLQGSFAKETYHFKEPTNRSQTIFKVILNALNMRERETSYLVNHDDQKMRGHSEKKIARKSRNSCRVKCSIECVEHERERNVISGLATVSRVDRIIGLFCRIIGLFCRYLKILNVLNMKERETSYFGWLRLVGSIEL